MSLKVIGLIDCNSFYCSCERVFRPDLIDSAVIVLSNNDGCAIARTSEAKALGIKMGDPYFKIKNLCVKNNVTVFSCNFSLYINISNRVMSIISNLCPDISVYSVDEAFTDLTGIQNLDEHGHLIKKTIFKNTLIPTCVGIAPTKVLAKLANNTAKKSIKSNGVVNLMSEKFRQAALARTPVEDIWGVGRASSVKLRQLGIKTALEFRDYKNEIIIQQILTKVGLQIKHELMGINCFELHENIEKKKEIMCSTTFGNGVYDRQSLKESIANYITDASLKMRKQNSICSEITIFATSNPFKEGEQHHISERVRLINPTCDTRKLIALAIDVVDKNFKEGIEYKKAGAKLSSFYNSDNVQLDLLGGHDSAEDLKLMQTIDMINKLEGSNTIKLGACGISDESWKMNQKFKSPRYLTRWDELKVFY
jgi:DNA polymerase V